MGKSPASLHSSYGWETLLVSEQILDNSPIFGIRPSYFKIPLFYQSPLWLNEYLWDFVLNLRLDLSRCERVPSLFVNPVFYVWFCWLVNLFYCFLFYNMFEWILLFRLSSCSLIKEITVLLIIFSYVHGSWFFSYRDDAFIGNF